MILFIIYRQFFSKAESHATTVSSNSVSIDTSEIEEKLKKILENQSAFKTTNSDGVVAPAPTVSAAPVVANTEEIEKLKIDIKEKEKVIEELKKGVAQQPVGAVGNKEDAKKFEEKIKELEGRLQEYEIISEDIADLSFYKEENARLQKELSAGGATKTATPAPVVPAPAAASVPESEVSPPVAASEASSPAEASSVSVAVSEPVVSSSSVAPEPIPVAAGDAIATSPEETAVVDDDILKEFAAAVEGQKQAESVSESQAVDAQKLTESKELMGEFENFIKKG
ncbi:MAG: hypothetical protein JNL11_04290 [Bdellovibrionaceae bacterium]|nr:hypothetical protein [Pseudobdellovibrionaceae bacterium]